MSFGHWPCRPGWSWWGRWARPCPSAGGAPGGTDSGGCVVGWNGWRVPGGSPLLRTVTVLPIGHLPHTRVDLGGTTPFFPNRRTPVVGGVSLGIGHRGGVGWMVMVGVHRPRSGPENVGRLLEGSDLFRAREAVAFANRRGERRVSWWAHRAELDVLDEEAYQSYSSMSSEVRKWWLDGLPLLVDVSVLSEEPEGWTPYAHHLPRYLPRARGTPREEWVEWPLPEGVLDLEAAATAG